MLESALAVVTLHAYRFERRFSEPLFTEAKHKTIDGRKYRLTGSEARNIVSFFTSPKQ